MDVIYNAKSIINTVQDFNIATKKGHPSFLRFVPLIYIRFMIFSYITESDTILYETLACLSCPPIFTVNLYFSG